MIYLCMVYCLYNNIVYLFIYAKNINKYDKYVYKKSSTYLRYSTTAIINIKYT